MAGTSLATPIVASVFALSGDGHGQAPHTIYKHPEGFNDITTGTNGLCSLFCDAKDGWDAITGVGTPLGPIPGW